MVSRVMMGRGAGKLRSQYRQTWCCGRTPCGLHTWCSYQISAASKSSDAFDTGGDIGGVVIQPQCRASPGSDTEPHAASAVPSAFCHPASSFMVPGGFLRGAGAGAGAGAAAAADGGGGGGGGRCGRCGRCGRGRAVLVVLQVLVVVVVVLLLVLGIGVVLLPSGCSCF